MHRLPLIRESNTPEDRAVFWTNRRLVDPFKKEVYNRFLRRKVFAMLQAMGKAAVSKVPRAMHFTTPLRVP